MRNLSVPATVVVDQPDYARSYADAIQTLRTDADALLADPKQDGSQAVAAAAKQAQADELEQKGAPTVKYHTDVSVICSGKGCPSPAFSASFPEVQRILICPACGRQVEVPAAYRGLP